MEPAVQTGKNNDGDCTTAMNHTINNHHHSNTTNNKKLEATLTRRLLSTLLNEEHSPLQELPSPSSSSFRLWLSFGVPRKDHEASHPGNADGDDDDEKNYCYTTLPPRWIVRPNGCPIQKQKEQGQQSHASSRSAGTRGGRQKKNANVLWLEFDRRGKHGTTTGDNSIDSSRKDKLDFLTSDDIIWISLPTCLKGFRL
jgi:hypothetical protein